MISTFNNFITPSAVLKAKDKFATATPKQFFTAAKNKDVDAINLLFYAGRSVIAKAFFKYYLGPNKSSWRARILDGDDREFASEIYAMLLGAGLNTNPIDSFDYKKYTNQNILFLINKFNYYLFRYSERVALILLAQKKRRGLSGSISSENLNDVQIGSLNVPAGSQADAPMVQDSLPSTDTSYNDFEWSEEVRQFLNFIKTNNPELLEVALLGAEGLKPEEIAQKLGTSKYLVQKQQVQLKSIYKTNFMEQYNKEDVMKINERADKNTKAGDYTPTIHYEPGEEIKKSKKFDVKVGDVLLLDPEAFHSYDGKCCRTAVVKKVRKDDTLVVCGDNGQEFEILNPQAIQKIKESASGGALPDYSAPAKPGATSAPDEKKIDLTINDFQEGDKIVYKDPTLGTMEATVQQINRDRGFMLVETKNGSTVKIMTRSEGISGVPGATTRRNYVLFSDIIRKVDSLNEGSIEWTFGRENGKNPWRFFYNDDEISTEKAKTLVSKDPKAKARLQNILSYTFDEDDGTGGEIKFEEGWRDNLPYKEKLFILKQNGNGCWAVQANNPTGEQGSFFTFPDYITFTPSDLQDIAYEYHGSLGNGGTTVRFPDKKTARAFAKEAQSLLKRKRPKEVVEELTDPMLNEASNEKKLTNWDVSQGALSKKVPDWITVKNEIGDDEDNKKTDKKKEKNYKEGAIGDTAKAVASRSNSTSYIAKKVFGVDPTAPDYSLNDTIKDLDESVEDDMFDDDPIEQSDYLESPMEEEGDHSFSLGDHVRVKSEYSINKEGDEGTVVGFSPSGSYVIVDIKGSGPASYHASDLEDSVQDFDDIDEDDFVEDDVCPGCGQTSFSDYELDEDGVLSCPECGYSVGSDELDDSEVENFQEAANPITDAKAYAVALLVDEHGWNESEAWDAVDDLNVNGQIDNWLSEFGNDITDTAQHIVGTIELQSKDEGNGLNDYGEPIDNMGTLYSDNPLLKK